MGYKQSFLIMQTAHLSGSSIATLDISILQIFFIGSIHSIYTEGTPSIHHGDNESTTDVQYIPHHLLVPHCFCLTSVHDIIAVEILKHGGER